MVASSSSNRRRNGTGRKAALHLAMYVLCLLSAYGLGFYSRTFLMEFAKALDPKLDFTMQTKRGSLPERWESYTFDQIYEHYECRAQAEDKSKPVPSLAQWLFLRKQYKEFVDDKIVFNDLVPPTEGYSFIISPEVLSIADVEESSHIATPPFYAKLDSVRGRGLYASRNIRRGEVVHHWSDHDVTFPDAYAFRQYVFSLPKRMACDVVDWAWSRKLSDKGPEMICLSLNMASLMNSGEKGEVNVSINSATADAFYATRDIQKDEEILTHFVRT